MSVKNDDGFINGLAIAYEASQLKDNVVAVDATYYLRLILENTHEPLVSATGGPLALEDRINSDLDKWKANDCTPLFIFDGCPVKGQDELSIELGRFANNGTDHAWELYSNAQAQSSVTNFGLFSNAYRMERFYPTFQAILRKRGLHFLVPPFKAVAQIAYLSNLSKTGETLCGAIMGPRELLLYPINDVLIQEVDWSNNRFLAVSKETLKNQLNIDDSILVDALLMTGTSFLPALPARVQPQQPPNTVRDAVNMLRANGKHVKQVCQHFDDVLKSQQPDWFDKYCKARMIVDHYIYIAINGAVEVQALDSLTSDSHEYMGLRLPDELHHYLNTGLVGPQLLSWVIHSRITILPTLDGIASDEYKSLVLRRLLPMRELALGLVVPRLNRGFHFKDIEVKAWFPDQQSTTIRNSDFRTPSPKVATWSVEQKLVDEHFPSWSLSAPASKDRSGSLAFEILSLQKPEFAKATVGKPGNKPKGIDAPAHIISTVIWRFLHLRDYVNDSHELTGWGKALATAMTELEPTVEKYSQVSGLHEALLLAFELIRLDQLNAKPRQDELEKGDVDPSLLLISRCAVLLKLRHDAIGYTGPLRKDMLAYFSQVSAVREADRDLVEAIVIHLFMNNQTKRERQPSEYWDISTALPFVNRNYNAAMGVAIRTFLEMDSEENRDLDKFASLYFPNSVAFREDVNIFCHFFKALVAGVKTLDQKELGTKDIWTKAQEYLESHDWVIINSESVERRVTDQEVFASGKGVEDAASDTAAATGLKHPRPRSWTDPGNLLRVDFLNGMEGDLQDRANKPEVRKGRAVHDENNIDYATNGAAGGRTDARNGDSGLGENSETGPEPGRASVMIGAPSNIDDRVVENGNILPNNLSGKASSSSVASYTLGGYDDDDDDGSSVRNEKEGFMSTQGLPGQWYPIVY
ncbi:hypothetical protein VP1G_07481 [Cytospora mali]|uniref:Protein MKT1 n=1 Tax=Cytospora mali TaxID=578113 RepID=A0A194V8T5_CYTMA|nr:hypothetical protein VP1G_07481 [Valsa mali var. pyri (nom. inval.)]